MSLWRRVFAERRRVVLPLVVVLLANVAVLALVVFPLKRAVSGSQQAALDAAMNLAKARKEDVDAKTARTSLERGDVELKKFYAEILPHNYAGSIDVLNDLLGDAADEVHLRYQAGSWDRDDVRDSSLTKVTGQITLTGDYNNIRQFLYNLETAKEFVVVEKVELSQANTVRANTLEVVLNVATYYVADQTRAVGK
jgi:Tfp pilus assembly protein PilO